jgi:hypothetical protein
MFQTHPFQVHLQLFGNQHRDGGIGPLPHLDIGHDQDNLAVGLDADEGIGREAVGDDCFGVAVCKRQVETQHEAAARCCSRLQNAPPGQTDRPWRSIRVGSFGSEVMEDQCQPPCSLDCAACLIASRMRT